MKINKNCIVFFVKLKVSGDQPVYVESVKIGGAAQKAGLVAGDMILKVSYLVLSVLLWVINFFFFFRLMVQVSDHQNTQK